MVRLFLSNNQVPGANEIDSSSHIRKQHNIPSILRQAIFQPIQNLFYFQI